MRIEGCYCDGMSEEEFPQLQKEYIWPNENAALLELGLARAAWDNSIKSGKDFQLPESIYAFRFPDGNVYFVALLRGRYVKHTSPLNGWVGPVSDNKLLERSRETLNVSDKYL